VANGEALVSLIIPAYNDEKYLARCLDSVIGQTYKNLQIILVDDGSTDASGKICDSYAAQDQRIQVLHQQNAGVSIARNHALAVATGEYLAFTDADDQVEPDYIETLVKNIAGYDHVIHQQNAGVSAARNSALDIAAGEYLGFTDADDKLDPDYVATLVKNIQGYDMVLCGYHSVDETGQIVEKCLPHNCVMTAQEFLHAYLDEEIYVFNGMEIRLAIGGYLWNKLFRLNIWNNIRFTLHLSMEDTLAVTSYVSRIKRINCVTDCKYFYYQILGSLTNTPGLHAHVADVIAIRKAQEQLVQIFVSQKQASATLFPKQTGIKLLQKQAGLLVLLAYFDVLRKYLNAAATNSPVYQQYVRDFRAAFGDRFSCLRLCKTWRMAAKLLLYGFLPGLYEKIWKWKYSK
jgi:glycosyltransferase involved in cell wall biosynthesis